MAKKPDGDKKLKVSTKGGRVFEIKTEHEDFLATMPPNQVGPGIIGRPMSFHVSGTRPPPRKPVTSQFDDDNDE